MKRRNFLQTTVTASIATGTVIQTIAADGALGREFYELRVYTLKDAAQRKLVEDYLANAFIPAMKRLGSSPIGVFEDQAPSNQSMLHVLIPHASMEAFMNSQSKLMADAEHNKAGASYLGIEAPDRAYERIESSLLLAFEGMPRLLLPQQTREKRSRIVQLRIYESHSELAGQKKIEMFHKGEIDIFKRVGLTPVFFAETILGQRRPNLTYLLVFDDKAALDKAWNTFRADPEWAKLKAVPEYADKKIVSKITNLVLKPASCSQI